MHRPLGSNEVHVWYRFTEAIDDRELSAAVSVLSSTEQSRYGGFRQAHDRRDYAAAHALLRQWLSRYGELEPRAWMFESNASGKPSVVSRDGAPPALSFSLSHTRGLVACAIATGADVGIDVEGLARAVDWSGIAARYFAPGEIEQLERCPRDDRASRFIELWTLKEAYMKATGVGLSGTLNDFGFDLAHGRAINFTPPPNVNGTGWQFALFAPSAHYRLAVAIASESERAWRIAARSSEDRADTVPTYVSARMTA